MKEIISKLLEIIKLIFEFLFSKTSEEVEIPEEEYEENPIVEDIIVKDNISISDDIEHVPPIVIEEDNSITANIPLEGKDYFTNPNPELIHEEEVKEEYIPVEVVPLPEEDIAHHKMNTEFTEEDMFFFFLNEGMNFYGVAGLMGNLYAESGLRSNNLQDTYSKKLGMTDEEYTLAIDSDTYYNFIRDSAGYGLAQWTFWSRKESLLKYASETNRSIGDCRMQCEFLVKELKESYKSVYEALCNANSVLEASNAVLLKFERPYDQSESVQDKRASFGQKYYEKYAIL